MKFSKDEIVAAIKKREDRKVLDFLYKSVYPKIDRYIRKNSGCLEDGQDVFQEAVMVFYQLVITNKHDKIYDIAGFLITVSRNIWINKVKKKRKEKLSEIPEDLPEQSDNQLVQIILSEKWNAFDKVFNNLGEKCKELLTYSVYEKLSMDQIAEKMNFSNANSAKTNNYRCKQKLLELVNRNRELINLLQS